MKLRGKGGSEALHAGDKVGPPQAHKEPLCASEPGPSLLTPSRHLAKPDFPRSPEAPLHLEDPVLASNCPGIPRASSPHYVNGSERAKGGRSSQLHPLPAAEC